MSSSCLTHLEHGATVHLNAGIFEVVTLLRIKMREKVRTKLKRLIIPAAEHARATVSECSGHPTSSWSCSSVTHCTPQNASHSRGIFETENNLPLLRVC